MDKTILISVMIMAPMVQMILYTFDLTELITESERPFKKPGMISFALLILEWFLLCVVGIFIKGWTLLLETGVFPLLTAATMVKLILFEFERNADIPFDELDLEEETIMTPRPDPRYPGTYIITKDYSERRR